MNAEYHFADESYERAESATPSKEWDSHFEYETLADAMNGVVYDQIINTSGHIDIRCSNGWIRRVSWKERGDVPDVRRSDDSWMFLIPEDLAPVAKHFTSYPAAVDDQFYPAEYHPKTAIKEHAATLTTAAERHFESIQAQKRSDRKKNVMIGTVGAIIVGFVVVFIVGAMVGG